MKKLFVLSLFIALGTIVYAQDFTTSTGYLKPKNSDFSFTCEDGVLYIRNHWSSGQPKKVLVKFPQNKNVDSFTVPSTISLIARGAFQNNKYIKTIRIPSTIGYIGDNAFDGCEQLTSIEIYDSSSAVREIEKDISPSEVKEVGRYNIQGVKVQEDEEGQVQIILYSDGTTKKVLK